MNNYCNFSPTFSQSASQHKKDHVYQLDCSLDSYFKQKIGFTSKFVSRNSCLPIMNEKQKTLSYNGLSLIRFENHESVQAH